MALVLLFCSATYASDDTSGAIIVQQQKILEQEGVKREIQDFEKREDEEEEVSEDEESDESDLLDTADEDDTKCIKFKEITIEGSTLLTQQDITGITDKYINKCITSNRITELVAHFANLYTTKGYITTNVAIKRDEKMKKRKRMRKQEFKTGIVTLIITEGRVENITFGTNSGADKITNYFITPLSKNSIINITAIDQIAENLSYIPSYNYKAKIEPSSNLGFSNINIDGERSRPVSLYAETDTINQQTTGHSRYAFGLKADNPLKLGDALDIKLTSTYNNVASDRYLNNFTYNWSMPVKWVRIGINSSQSHYLAINNTSDTRTDGNTSSNSFHINGTVFKSKDIKTTLGSAFNIASSQTNNYSTTTTMQSRTLINTEVNVINNLYTNYGNFFHKITYIRGLGSIGNIIDTSGPLTASAEFDAIKFYQLYTIKIDKLFQRNTPFTFQNVIDAQYTWQDVYSQNRFMLGGFYSIRGFRDVSIYGSRGILMRNDIDFALGDYISNKDIVKILTQSGKNSLTLGAFFDIGTISSNMARNTSTSIRGISCNNGVLAGAGYKAGYKSKNFQASLTVAYSLLYPTNLHSSIQQYDGQIIYLTAKGTW